MPLTKDFKETVRARLMRSAEFRKEVLEQALDCLLTGELDTGKALLRDYVNGTVGFEKLGTLTHTPAKSLMRMLGPAGNPQARNLFGVLAHLPDLEGARFQISLTTKPRRRRVSVGFARKTGTTPAAARKAAARGRLRPRNAKALDKLAR